MLRSSRFFLRFYVGSETFEKPYKTTFVIPAKAGIQLLLNSSWIPGQARNDKQGVVQSSRVYVNYNYLQTHPKQEQSKL